MEGFREGYEFFQEHAGNFAGHTAGVHYLDSVESVSYTHLQLLLVWD